MTVDIWKIIKEERAFLYLFVIVVLTSFFLLFCNTIAIFAKDINNEKEQNKTFLSTGSGRLLSIAKPCVVNIKIEKEDNLLESFPFPFISPEFRKENLGSGFIIDLQGYIITNKHVIAGVNKIKVKFFNGEEYDAKLIGCDSNTDLALIKIDKPKIPHFLSLGNSEGLKIGTWVVAIGSPFGFEQTVTAGIVSAKGRAIGSGPYDSFIQTDVSINLGNSGGPLLNMKGEVVGVNTAIIASGHGIGFAIPANLAKKVIEQLRGNGEFARAWLGIAIQDLTHNLAEYYKLNSAEGAMIVKVFYEDPAHKSNLMINDVIIEIDNKRIKNAQQLSSEIGNKKVGTNVGIKFFRDGKLQITNIRLTQKKIDQNDLSKGEEKNISNEINWIGMKVVNIKSKVEATDESGVLIINVKKDTLAHSSGFSANDIIKEINWIPVKSLDDLKELIEEDTQPNELKVLIKRKKIFFVIKVKKLG